MELLGAYADVGEVVSWEQQLGIVHSRAAFLGGSCSYQWVSAWMVPCAGPRLPEGVA